MALKDSDIAKALEEKKLLKKAEIQRFISFAQNKKVTLEEELFEREALPDETMAQLFSELYKVPFAKLGDKTIPEPLLRIVPYNMAAKQSIIPFDQVKNEVSIAISNPHNYELLNFIEKKTGFKVKAFYATPKEIKAALKAYNKDVNEKFTKLLAGAMKDPTKIESLQDAAKILDTVILFAYQNDASDIHLEPGKDYLVVRYRIDGILHTIAELPAAILELLSTRIKVLANLRTDEHRAAQDGRIKIDLEGNEITLRISIVPTYDGEKTVMRILSSNRQELNLEALGYNKHNLKVIKSNMLKTNGIILMTGPTGSGKTTTLYTMVKQLNSPEVNISTIEDPIEYRLEGINQIQVNNKADLTFANGLRALLRQDPDIIMVGEIRDEETAGIAINAALTGHLVFATLHTNDASSTLPRMLEMGVEGFLLSATAKLVIAQRLVRRICDKCKVTFELKPKQLEELKEKYGLTEDLGEVLAKFSDINNYTVARGEGCAACNDSGFKGRTSISEVIEVSGEVQSLILNNAIPTVLEDQARKEGMITLFEDGMMKVLDHETTIEEILRVMHT
jgi:type IV pilus assembly protein PilB